MTDSLTETLARIARERRNQTLSGRVAEKGYRAAMSRCTVSSSDATERPGDNADPTTDR